MAANVTIRRADLNDSADATALVTLLDRYSQGPTGQGHPLADDVRERLAKDLVHHPTVVVYLACIDHQPVGIAVGFLGYSTFAARPLFNLHDLAVLPEHRDQGIGSRLLATVEDFARQQGCCKVTLEVLDRNESARRIYAQAGYGSFDDPTWFLSKRL
ncbi:GNAT family N-acetyltransferase [bacterium]|nr:GNAT family N-acetyltransferase [bacterium]